MPGREASAPCTSLHPGPCLRDVDGARKGETLCTLNRCECLSWNRCCDSLWIYGGREGEREGACCYYVSKPRPAAGGVCWGSRDSQTFFFLSNDHDTRAAEKHVFTGFQSTCCIQLYLFFIWFHSLIIANHTDLFCLQGINSCSKSRDEK